MTRVPPQRVHSLGIVGKGITDLGPPLTAAAAETGNMLRWWKSMVGKDWLLTRNEVAAGKGGEKDVEGRGTPPMWEARMKNSATLFTSTP